MRCALIAAAALWLAACGRVSLPHAASAAAPRPAAAPRDAQQNKDADLVAAVGSAHSDAPINVKFRLDKRPQLGVPLQILVAIIPASNAQIGHLHGSFLPDTGMSVQGDRAFDAKDLRAGEPLEHQLTVVPEQPGVLNVNATFTLDLDNGSVTYSYAIPVIVGDNSS
jgi:hypothetical protein